MPSIDIDVDDFLYSCSKYDIKNLINALVEDGHLPNSVYYHSDKGKEKISKLTSSEIDFYDKLDQLKEKYFSISKEDEDILSSIFKKYI